MKKIIFLSALLISLCCHGQFKLDYKIEKLNNVVVREKNLTNCSATIDFEKKLFILTEQNQSVTSYFVLQNGEKGFWTLKLDDSYLIIDKEFTAFSIVKGPSSITYYRLIANRSYISVNRAFFYNSPNLETRKKAYLVKGDTVVPLEFKNGFVYAEFVNHLGRKTKGWLRESDLIH